jgi:hypothetical protein
LLRRARLDEVGLFEEGMRYLLEDWVLWARLASRTTFLFLPEPCVHYRCHQNAFCHNLDQDKWVKAVREWLGRLFQGSPPWASRRRAVYRHWAGLLLPAAEFYAERGQRWRAVRVLSRLAIAFHPAVVTHPQFRKACVKMLLGRWGLSALHYLRNRRRPISRGVYLGPRVEIAEGPSEKLGQPIPSHASWPCEGCPGNSA